MNEQTGDVSGEPEPPGGVVAPEHGGANDAHAPRRSRPDGWVSRAARLSPALGALAILLVYLIFVPLFINKCGWLDSRCGPPQIRTYLASQGLCACAEGGDCQISLDANARLWPGRFLWVFATGVGVLANLLAVGVGLYTIWQARTDRVLVLTALTVFLLVVVGAFTPPGAMMSQMFELLECTAQADLPFVIRATHIANVFSVAATVCIATASCVLVRAPRGLRRQGVPELYALTERLRVLLYTGTCALVIYVLRVSIQASWALAYLPSSPEKKPYDPAVVMSSLTSAFTSAQAASSTLLLAAIYIPAFLILRSRAIALADPGLTPEAREKWLKERGLSVSFTEHLPRVAAILGPLLAGPLGDLLGRLSK